MTKRVMRYWRNIHTVCKESFNPIMQRLPFATYRDQTNRIIYLHENTRNERLMQKKTPITDPLCRSVQCLWPFLIVRPKDPLPETANLWWEPIHQWESPDPLVAPGRRILNFNQISIVVYSQPNSINYFAIIHDTGVTWTQYLLCHYVWDRQHGQVV